MAAALQPFHSEPTPTSFYPRGIMGEFEYGDNRYPSLRQQSRTTQQSTTSRPTTADRSWQQAITTGSDNQQFRTTSDSLRGPLPWQHTGDQQESQTTSRTPSRKDQRVPESQFDQMQDVSRTTLSYALPPGAARWAVERHNSDNNSQRSPSRTSNEPSQPYGESQSIQETVTPRNLPRSMASSRVNPPVGRASPNPSLSRFSANQNGQNPSHLQDSQIPPIIPLSASPTYVPPVSPNPRAYAHQPTYVNQFNGKVIQAVYTPIVPQQEEVCVECAMRDKDMVDVDVSSPGVWERASDVVFEEIKKREIEEAASGVLNSDPSRPRIKGGRLTEQNLKLWLSINPREPASKQQTLNTYIRSQRALLEAEALAHARAMQEAKSLDIRMRDAYAGIRMSAYSVGGVVSPIDDFGGVRIRPPTTPTAATNHSRARSHSREVTLLENGLIVEHVDIKREEKEARERRRKEEKRTRKSSKSSAMDVNSIISQGSGQFVDGGLKPSSRFSQAHSVRPTSVFSKSDRIDIPRAYSQLSFTDAQSLGSASPRRTRFFGNRHLIGGWRSQDSLAPSGMSGSMVDMHVALQRDAIRHPHPIDLNTPNRSQIWPPIDPRNSSMSQGVLPTTKSKKKIGGLAKIWRKVTGKTDQQEIDVALHHDDSPLPLPPPLSYLVERKYPNDFGASGSNRHGSTPSLPSISSPKAMGHFPPGMSPPTAPSSILPSPVSLQQFGDIEIVDGRQTMYSDGPAHDDPIREEDATGQQNNNLQSMQSFVSEPDLRPHNLQIPSKSQVLPIPNGAARPMPLSRDKSLPPIPVGEIPIQALPSDRPKTFYAFESTPKIGSRDLAPPEAPFRGADRRHSLNGAQTLPIIRPVDFDAGRSLGRGYDEFGSSRSLGVLDHIQENHISQPTKRKSKFGLNALLGKKNNKREQESFQCDNQLLASLPYDAQDDTTTTGYATSTSRHSALSSSAAANMRMSTYSRRPLEELVQQDTEFLAYRYPSSDQRLDPLR